MSAPFPSRRISDRRRLARTPARPPPVTMILALNYTFHFGQIAGDIPYLLGGGLVSLEIGAAGLLSAAWCRHHRRHRQTFGGPRVQRSVRAYVVFFTNTPQLVQISFLFFVLPASRNPARAVPGGAAGHDHRTPAPISRKSNAPASAPFRQTELDAAAVLGMSTWQSVRYVILPHVVSTLFAPLSNHFILMVLGTSMAAVFGVEELTGRAYNINAQTFRSLEIFSVTGALYVAITLLPRRCWSSRPHAVPCAHAHRVTLGSPLAQMQNFFTFYNAEFLLGAMLTTLLLSALGCGIGLVVGFGLAVVRRMRRRGFGTPAGRRNPVRGTVPPYPVPGDAVLHLLRHTVAGFDASLFSIATISVLRDRHRLSLGDRSRRPGFRAPEPVGQRCGRQLHADANTAHCRHSTGLEGRYSPRLRILSAVHQGFRPGLADRSGRTHLCWAGTEQPGLRTDPVLRLDPAPLLCAVISIDAAGSAIGGTTCRISTSLTSLPPMAASPCCAG